MSETRERRGQEPTPTPFGLGRATLEAAIAAELEQAGGQPDAAAIAAAVAAAIEANNEELLRHLNQVLSAEAAPGPVQTRS